MVHRPRPPLPGPRERGPRRRLPVRREVPKLTERSSAGQARLPAVFDTGPIIYFDFLEYLPLLGSHFRVIIPDAVASELARRPGTPGSGAPSLRFVEVLAPDPEDVRHVVSGPPPIDAGEREVIALAFGRSATAVI